MGDIFLTGDQGQSTDQPGSPALQSIPNLDGTAQGLYSTVDALVNTVRALAGQGPDPNNASRGSSKTAPKNNQKNNQKDNQKNTARFIEKSRTTQQVTVKDTSSGATLTYTQITQLVMQDTVTGETWQWNL